MKNDEHQESCKPHLGELEAVLRNAMHALRNCELEREVRVEWYVREIVEDLKRIIGLLRGGGYTVIEGRDAVLAAIAEESDGSTEQRCSGYGVFPDGTKCAGCGDCRPNEIRSATVES